MADEPHLQGRHFIVMLQKYFWQYISFSIPPKIHFFQNRQCFRDCEPSEIYTSLSFLYKCEILEAYISLDIDIFYIFLSGNFWRGWFICEIHICKFCIFLRSTGKHDMYSGQKSDIVWCDIFRSYCSFNQYGEQNPTEVLRFLFCISHLKDNYTKMQMILFIDYSWTFLSFSFSIFILCICYHSLIDTGLCTLEQLPWRLLCKVLLYVCGYS